MRILLTGFSGYIGGKVARHLIDRHEIYALSRKKPKTKNINWIEMGLGADLDTNKLPEVDAIIHFAQSNNYRNFPDQGNDIFDINIRATQRLLDFAVKTKVKSFIFSSSGSVYEPYEGEMLEDSPVAPTSFYSISKLVAEQIMLGYSSFLNTCVLRIFFPYGPGQKDKLFPNLLNSIQSKEPITLFGDQAGMKITPIYIDDLLTVISAAIEDSWKGTYNVAGPHQYSLREITTKMATHLDVEVNYENKPGNAFDIKPSVNKIRDKINLNAFKSLDEGLTRMIYDQRP